MKNKKFIIFVLVLLLVLPITYAKITNDGIYGVSIYGAVDVDNDAVWDSYDNLLYNATYVTTTGVTELNVTVGGNIAQGTFNDTHEVVVKNQTDLIANFTHNFTKSILDLSLVSIQKTSTYLIVNFSNQVQENKTLYIEDNSFIGLCVKDEEISSITEMSTACTGTNETDFTTCLGNNTGVNLNGVICIDNGTIISVQNLSYSAIRGTLATPVTPVTPSGGGGGGGTTSSSFTITPTKISTTIKQGETSLESMVITNTGNSLVTISLQESGLGDLIRISELSLTLGAGESKIIFLDFLAREDTSPDLYMGKLLISGGGITKEILVVVEVESKESLFDVMLDIPEEFSQVAPGNNMFVKINLFRLQSTEKRVDVTLIYSIRNSLGEEVIQHSETVAVETSASLIHEFEIHQNMKGDYILYVQAIYEDTISSASGSFEVTKTSVSSREKTFILFALCLFIILAVIIYIYESRKISHKIKRKIGLESLIKKR